MKRPLAARVFKMIAVLAALPAIASAHPGHDGGHDLTWDFAGGFQHPIFGLDHLLAMIAVGVWAMQIGGRGRWLIPATFVGVMTLGAAIGTQGVAFPAVEQMIAASLLVFGLMIAMAKRLPIYAGLGLTALFALFHGIAHGAEIPANSNGLSYGLGFVIATVALHSVGLALGKLSASQSSWFAKAAGAGVATVGAVMLVA
ncbi:HupE/UreJ family protein [Rariglobus hedericola]|uniref:HupE/UreJ family protein n=1 Tax=Rariglobus hedericola TaxID=2597822 RepID=A0A556QLD5_9BACT|nr:HupE/UreJ family protein [Rariglobus hedericola]TSJ77460.1 HupE/UreJ family protein [Rariglobus hedericola]